MTALAQRKIRIADFLPKEGRIYATGRRKEASARVWVAKGTGRIVINGRPGEEYLARPVLVMMVNQPFVATDTAHMFDIWCTVDGSGLSGQAGAIRHGVSRALSSTDEERRTKLKEQGLLTRDSRSVERKKAGRKKARKDFQFSKR